MRLLNWISAALLAVPLGAGVAIADEKEVWAVELRGITVDKVSSGEPGIDLELYGFAQVISANGADGALVSPLGDRRDFWTVDKNLTIDLAAGQSNLIPGIPVLFELSPEDLEKGSLALFAGVWDKDDTSSDDLIGLINKTISFKEPEVPITLERDGEKVTLLLTISPVQTEISFARPEPTGPLYTKTTENGLEKVVFLDFIADRDLPSIFGQTPRADPRIKISAGKNPLGQVGLLIDLYNTSFAAAKDGKLLMDSKDERGYFLEAVKVTVTADGMTVTDQAPKSHAQRATSVESVTASFDANVSLSGPSAGGGFGVTKGTSTEYEVFQVSNDAGDVQDGSRSTTVHSYELRVVDGNIYREPKDLLDPFAQFGGGLRELPVRAVSALDINSWVLFGFPSGKQPGKLDTVSLTVEFDLTFRLVDYTFGNIYHQKFNQKLVFRDDVDLSMLND